MTYEIDASEVIDSRDIIERLETLKEEREGLIEAYAENRNHFTRQSYLAWIADNREELKALEALCREGEESPDWSYGETMIREDYFEDYTRELVADCYEMPKGYDVTAWPWRHLKIDWKAAAEELKADYFEVTYCGHTYFIRG